MRDVESIALLRKFVRDQCTPQELDEVKELLQNGVPDAIWNSILEEEQATSLREDQSLPAGQVERMFQSILGHIHKGRTAKGKQRYLQPLRWAAAIAAVVISSAVIFQLLRAPYKGRMEYAATRTGEHKHLHLNDSSQIWINAASSLQFPAVFDKGKREAFLKGEAFFAIEKDPSRPFFVHVGEVTIQVLGTSFNIKSFEEDSDVTVTLATGRIKVLADGVVIAELGPGEQLVYSKMKRTIEKQVAQVTDSYAWKDHMLIFNQEKLTTVTASLERIYGVHFVIEDMSLRQLAITFKQKETSLQDALEVLSFTAKLQYDIRGDTIILSKNKLGNNK